MTFSCEIVHFLEYEVQIESTSAGPTLFRGTSWGIKDVFRGNISCISEISCWRQIVERRQLN